MHEDPITAPPDTPTLEAINLMKRHRIGCLPIVDGTCLAGIVTAHGFMTAAGQLPAAAEAVRGCCGARPHLGVSPLAAILAVAVLLALLPAPPARAAHPAAVRGTGGAVASGDARATEAGLSVLAAGGNAVDAAVATALALAVTFPEAGNLGGGGFAVVRLEHGPGGGDDEVLSLDFRETAPAAARRDMYLDAAGEPVPDASLVGPLAAGVPGSPAGLWELHRRLGRLPWKRVVEPARRLAAEGFPVTPHLARRLEEHRGLLARFPETARVWLPGGAPPPVGATLRLPAVAATLAAYAERGPQAIAGGAVAAAVEAASARHGGVLTAADLAAYEPRWRPPLRFAAFGWDFAGMDLPSSGGILTAETLGLLERTGWAARPRFGAERAHLLAEAWRRAYADRFLLGDPTATAAAAAELLDPRRLDALAARLDRERATASAKVAPGTALAAAEAGSGETTHLSVSDGEGNLVALSTTLNGLFGSGLWVPGFGFLNNEMDDFSTAPGTPNLYGLVQGEANAVRPGRRMLSSMSPTVAWRRGDGGVAVVAVGGRGGSRIPTATVQFLLHLLVDGDPLQAALDRPRIHHQWLPDLLRFEPDALAPETRAALTARGHELEPIDAVAGLQAVRRLAGGDLEAAGDPRDSGTAGVVERALQ
jgi:gamma-glutamyltranspeptidase / glutathione hydrolase